MSRVLITAPTWGSFGGMEQFMWDVAAAIAHEPGLEPRICLKQTKAFALRPELTRLIDAAPAPVTVVPRGSAGLARAIAGADLVHAQTMSPDVALLARALRKPLVLTIHNRRLGTEGWRGAVGQRAAGAARARWYNSDFVWRSWEPGAPRPTSEKLPVIDPQPVEPLAPHERRGFVFAGRWIENKGLDVLVEAYAAAALDRDRWPLTLLGDGPLRPRIERRVADLGLEDAVAILGFVDRAVRDERIRGAKWMVTPPHTNEDLGLTPIEARACGVPCIVTRDGGVPEAAGPFSLICAPASVDHLRRALEFAAGMGDEEYARFAHATRDLLFAERRGFGLYAERYRRILG